ncbi:hypothetical protein [Aequorivita viscosa]|uniref:tRNA_anti-like n=1 Tax=Aequorivita viscosa TaxID=797419 RepID=A0A1M6MKN8_9FLAO|nr:hypothetical protein [Aequorivita viscosa]SDX51003.1 hypothetical protein SAMN05216556_13817 [Aequorivita viscosa]SHJ84065.1 hypothetical protein SAMN04487908_1285 [Aequorivita viscosa]
MKKITTIILTLLSLTSFAQSIETITEKISDKICECMSDNLKNYSEIKPEFNRCYDKEFNFIFNIVDSAEHKILVQNGALDKVKNGIIPTLNERCEKIRKLIKADVENSTESETKNPCPTNFESKDLKKISKRNGEIVAFNGLVTKVYTAHNDKPYYQVKLEGGNTIWIASLVNSGYEKEGKIIRLLGYVSEVGNDEIAKQYNQTDYHILAFCVIDMDSKQMAMMPGSELQVKEWMNGTIPKAKK